jgi:hypothetical protein
MQWIVGTTIPSRGLGLNPIGKSKLAAFDAAGDIFQHTAILWGWRL